MQVTYLVGCNIAIHGLFSDSDEGSQVDMARAAREEISTLCSEIELPTKVGFLLSRAESTAAGS